VPLRLGVAGLVAICVAAGLIGARSDAVAGAGAQRPNVVVVMSDDQDTDSMRVMKQTQRLLVRQGVSFTRHYATFPLCCPSRAAYLTGQYAHNSGVTGSRGFLELDAGTTSAVALRQAGYRTAWIGKYLNGYPSYARKHPHAIPQGYSRWYAGITGRMFGWVVNDDGRLKRLENTPRNYQTDVYTRQGQRFIRQSVTARKPFFLTLAPLAPHGEPKRSDYPDPRPAPRDEGRFRHAALPKPKSFNEADVQDKPKFVRNRDRLDRPTRLKLRDRYRSRLASLLAVDDMVARIVGLLKRAHELRDTYIVFTSDNGFLLGEHRLTGKTLLYEESGKVPMIIRGPGLEEGAVHAQPTGNIDVTATIYDAVGVEPAVEPDGVSLLPIARHPEKKTGRHLLLENRRSTGVEDGRYVYLEHDYDDDKAADEYELYDLIADPLQLENLHLTHAPQVRPAVLAKRPGLAGRRDELADELAALRACAGASCN
jgi:arylsulfatase A-like enzyme